MSDKQAIRASDRKPSSNKNIKKLRTLSVVCNLTSSWQQWVTDNEKKQASEPSGWAPSSLGGETEKPFKKWVPKKTPQPSSKSPSEAQTSQTSIAEQVGTSDEVLPSSCIRTKQVVKTVTSSVQEKSAGVGLLTEKIKKESLPSSEEVDQLLRKKSSPTRRRKCSNMVSSLTKSWKQVEQGRTLKEGGEGHDYGEDKGEEESDTQDALIEKISTPEESKPTRDTVRIKRPQASTYRKEAEDANKINALSKTYSTVGNLKSRWQNWAVEHTVNQKLNPFSEYFDYDYSMSLRLQKGQEGYGRPKEGTKTAERAKRAEQHILREIDDMCYVIRTMADPDLDGKTRVTFGELFDR
ncbi:actin binding Rho activating protein b [Nothobranchius furzeri]|uniref:Actin binding Rho activating protein n=2 Tax=Nothobranchius furzeri TaxID=105023 RepID=A0A9D3BLB0_NOTFU|nr:actin binding Rho activating protein [Nothobranchius furzeri]